LIQYYGLAAGLRLIGIGGVFDQKFLNVLQLIRPIEFKNIFPIVFLVNQTLVIFFKRLIIILEVIFPLLDGSRNWRQVICLASLDMAGFALFFKQIFPLFGARVFPANDVSIMEPAAITAKTRVMNTISFPFFIADLLC